jgi:4-hydroxyacetophenone monooxygenase
MDGVQVAEHAIRSAIPEGLEFPIRDEAALRQAIDESMPQLPLMVLAQLTGDETLLDRAAPYVKSMWQGATVFPPELDREIRDRLFSVLTRAETAHAPPVSEAFLKKMMGVCVGEPVADEFIPLLIEQMGFEPAGRFVPAPRKRPPEGYKVVVIGAGMSGIAAGVKLAEAGYDFRIYDKNDEVGGVWWQNTYPGVAVDTPSHFYSFSFLLNAEWPRFFSSGPVLMDYWRRVVEAFDLRKYMSLKTEIRSCVYDESAGRWRVNIRSADGQEGTVEADAVICAAGLFSHPAEPDIPGLADFAGPKLHTAYWDPSVDLDGKRVALIGTGASAVQAGPSIAGRVAHLDIFQRTPPWVMVRPDRDYNKEVADSFKWALGHIPHFAQWMRFYTYWFASDGTYAVVKVDPNWPESDTSVNAAGEAFRQMLLAGIQKKLGDRPDLIAKITPNYPVMGKRILQDSYWYDTLRRDNVDLVTTPIDRIVADGVLTKDGQHHPVDVLVLATGFTMTKMLRQIEFVGRGGQTLHDTWGEEDPRAYLGTLVPGFPNLFMIGGPNGGATHGAGVNIYSEAQVNYILACLDTLFETGAKTIEPTQAAHDDYNEGVDRVLEKMVWSHRNVTTYYRNSQGRNFISCPWRIVDFWHMMRAPKLDDMTIGQ